MAVFKYHSSSMVSIMDRIDEGLDGIQGELENLDQVAAQLSGQWTGEASEAFAAAHREWTDGLTGLEQVARRLTAVVRTTAGRSDEQQRRGAAVWGG
jgi:WXG100 family type VII secretion target